MPPLVSVEYVMIRTKKCDALCRELAAVRAAGDAMADAIEAGLGYAPMKAAADRYRALAAADGGRGRSSSAGRADRGRLAYTPGSWGKIGTGRVAVTDIRTWLRVRLFYPALLAVIALAQLLRPIIGMDRAEAWARRALSKLG